MPSVTEVLGYLTEPELVKWIENNSKAKRKQISDAALDLGSRVDGLVQLDIKDGGYLVPENDVRIASRLRAWELFKKEHPEFVPSVIEIQTELTDGIVVGHPDFIHANGITDLKCSNSIWPKYWTQTAKYLDLRKIKPPRFIAILRLKDDGGYEYLKIEDEEYIKYEISVFEAYLVAYNHAFKNRELIRRQLEEEVLNVT